jgi:hypothetical protein
VVWYRADNTPEALQQGIRSQWWQTLAMVENALPKLQQQPVIQH